MTREVGEHSVINVIYHLFDSVTASADRPHVREPPTNESAGAFVGSHLRAAACRCVRTSSTYSSCFSCFLGKVCSLHSSSFFFL